MKNRIFGIIVAAILGGGHFDGDFQKGPKAVFLMPDGYTHWYQGFVSPNNICGKLKFFMPNSKKPNRQSEQNLGALGITMHTFYTSKLDLVFDLVKKHVNLTATSIQKNEFGERAFVVRGREGTTWQLIERIVASKNKPTTQLKMTMTNDYRQTD